MFCPNCGTQIADGSAFCPNCGKPVKTAVAAQTFVPPDSDPRPPIHGDTKSSDPVYLNGGGPVYTPAASPVQGGYPAPVKEKKKPSLLLWILIGVGALAVLAGIVLGILALTGVLGGKNGKDNKKNPTAGMTKEQVAIQAVQAYYTGDLKTFANYTAYDYMQAARLRIAGYDSDYNSDLREAFRSDAEQVTDQQLQAWLDDAATDILDEAVYDHTYSYYTYDELANGYQIDPVIEDPDTDVEVFVGDDLEYGTDLVDERLIPGTWCRVWDLTDLNSVTEVARIRVRVNFTTQEEGQDYFYARAYVVKINGAWKIVYIDD